MTIYKPVDEFVVVPAEVMHQFPWWNMAEDVNLKHEKQSTIDWNLSLLSASPNFSMMTMTPTMMIICL